MMIFYVPDFNYSTKHSFLLIGANPCHSQVFLLLRGTLGDDGEVMMRMDPQRIERAMMVRSTVEIG